MRPNTTVCKKAPLQAGSFQLSTKKLHPSLKLHSQISRVDVRQVHSLFVRAAAFSQSSQELVQMCHSRSLGVPPHLHCEKEGAMCRYAFRIFVSACFILSGFSESLWCFCQLRDLIRMLRGKIQYARKGQFGDTQCSQDCCNIPVKKWANFTWREIAARQRNTMNKSSSSQRGCDCQLGILTQKPCTFCQCRALTSLGKGVYHFVLRAVQSTTSPYLL